MCVHGPPTGVRNDCLNRCPGRLPPRCLSHILLRQRHGGLIIMNGVSLLTRSAKLKIQLCRNVRSYVLVSVVWLERVTSGRKVGPA